jgi:pimeloyl-ACP methyl ester carboxylesterase
MADTVVVYVHGLWFSGLEATLLRARLARLLGTTDRVFSYPSVRSTLDENAAALGRFLAQFPAATLHLVGHSMGGALILRLLAAQPPLPPGRIVLLGSPLQGSEAGRSLAALPGGRALLGQSMRELLLPGTLTWAGGRELGIIAGDTGFGLGRLVNRFHDPSDGTVRVEETRLPGATAHLVLPVTHSGFLVSREVVRQTAAFLQGGRFAA